MATSIRDHLVADNDFDCYDVTFYSDVILTLVTASYEMVDCWISEILELHIRRLNRLIVGLDVEWRPNLTRDRNNDNPVATLQLCVGRRCLIFQIIHAHRIPQSLVEFLKGETYTFVGVGVGDDVEKLRNDYQLDVPNTVDLRVLAVEKLGQRNLSNAGLKDLVTVVLGKEIDKPREVTLSPWDNEWLSPAQVQYACLDAFLSFDIGRELIVER